MAIPFRLPARCFAALLTGVGLTLQAAPLSQPVAPVRPVTDTYFGTPVVDNYRWMEDLKSPEVQAWMKAQSDYTHDYLAKLPERDALLKRIQELDNASTRVADLNLCGGRYFYMKITPADQTPKFYVRDGLDGKERLLADAQVLGGKDKRYTLGEIVPSPDGKLVTVQIAAGGGEVGTLRVIDATTGKPLKDTIDRILGPSVSWDPSNKFFFYTRMKKLEPNESPNDKELDEASYIHHIGDSADKDVMVFGRVASPTLGLTPTDWPVIDLTPGSPYAIGLVAHGVRNEATIFISPVDAAVKGAPVWTKIIDVDDDVTDLCVKGHDIWLLSHKDAPHFKILHMDLDHPDLAKADTVIPNSDLVLKGLGAAKDGVYVHASKGSIDHLLRIADGQSTSTEVALPFAGGIDISTDVQNDGALLRLTGWTEAPQWYAYDPATGKITNTNLEPLNPVSFSTITSVEVTAPAPDGTQVPLSIIYKKDLKLDGQNPCLLEGYGSYGMSIDPGFDATRLALLEKGIVIAYAHVRGGGENGEDWHLAGQKATKQNTITDMIACAQYLIDKGYTSPGKLAGRGTSAGGITIGGALTQRPDLFTLCIVNVGMVNALRSETGPNGPANVPEFGSVSDAEGFKNLYAMDAIQHVKDGTPYPAVLLITGANDRRVDPWNLFKMTARLQAATSSKNPVLLRIDYDLGHGMGSSKAQRDGITADQGALLLQRAAEAPVAK